MDSTDTVRVTSQVVAAFASNHRFESRHLPDIVRSVRTTFEDIVAPAALPPQPAVPIEKSVTRTYIVCLEDGRRLKSMKRHIRTRYGMSPEDYRRRWNLPHDYPMVAPEYAKRRSDLAKAMGLGRGGRRRRG